MRASSLSLVLCCLCVTAQAQAQGATGSGSAGGTMSPRIQYDYRYANVGQGPKTQSWLQYIILWRGQPNWGEGWRLSRRPNTSDSRTYRALQRAAEDSGLAFLGGMRGGVSYVATIDEARKSLHILGRMFDIPVRDSAIVVMVDRVDSVGGPPVVAGVAYINSSITDAFWEKSWSSGDTTFIIRPHNEHEIVRSILAQNPAVRAFLR